jgi:hypothetical protein
MNTSQDVVTNILNDDENIGIGVVLKAFAVFNCSIKVELQQH